MLLVNCPMKASIATRAFTSTLSKQSMFKVVEDSEVVDEHSDLDSNHSDEVRL